MTKEWICNNLLVHGRRKIQQFGFQEFYESIQSSNLNLFLPKKRPCFTAYRRIGLKADFYTGCLFVDFLNLFQNPSAVCHDDAAFSLDDEGEVVFTDFDEPIPWR